MLTKADLLILDDWGRIVSIRTSGGSDGSSKDRYGADRR